MKLAFTLKNGTQAGIAPARGLQGLVARQMELGCLTPAKKVAVTFHVPNERALDRIMARFGTGRC